MEDKIERLSQIIEDLYINGKIGTLDNYLSKPERVKEITEIVYHKDRVINSDPKYLTIVKELNKKNDNLTRYKCLLCGRNKFTRKSPHKCVGGFRKRGFIWFKFQEESPEEKKLVEDIIKTTKSW